MLDDQLSQCAQGWRALLFVGFLLLTLGKSRVNWDGWPPCLLSYMNHSIQCWFFALGPCGPKVNQGRMVHQEFLDQLEKKATKVLKESKVKKKNNKKKQLAVLHWGRASLCIYRERRLVWTYENSKYFSVCIAEKTKPGAKHSFWSRQSRVIGIYHYSYVLTGQMYSWFLTCRLIDLMKHQFYFQKSWYCILS